MKIIKTAGWGRRKPWHQRATSKIEDRIQDTSVNDVWAHLLERGGKDIEVEVTYDFEPGEEATRDYPGSPGSPGIVHIHKTVDEFGTEIELTEKERDRIENEIMRHLKDYFTTPPDIELF